MTTSAPRHLHDATTNFARYFARRPATLSFYSLRCYLMTDTGLCAYIDMSRVHRPIRPEGSLSPHVQMAGGETNIDMDGGNSFCEFFDSLHPSQPAPAPAPFRETGVDSDTFVDRFPFSKYNPMNNQTLLSALPRRGHPLRHTLFTLPPSPKLPLHHSNPPRMPTSAKTILSSPTISGALDCLVRLVFSRLTAWT